MAKKRMKRRAKKGTAQRRHYKTLFDAYKIVYYEQQRLKKIVDDSLDPIWTTTNMESMRMSGMEEGHLRNAISYAGRRLVHKIGTSTWVSTAEEWALKYSQLLREAKRRNIRV